MKLPRKWDDREWLRREATKLYAVEWIKNENQVWQTYAFMLIIRMQHGAWRRDGGFYGVIETAAREVMVRVCRRGKKMGRFEPLLVLQLVSVEF